jgi:hypothetical protein
LEQAISPDSDGNVNVTFFQAMAGLVLRLKPSLGFYVTTTLERASFGTWSADIGVGLNATWEFAGAPDMCPCPSLSGDITLSALALFKVTTLTIDALGSTPLIPEYSAKVILIEDTELRAASALLCFRSRSDTQILSHSHIGCSNVFWQAR